MRPLLALTLASSCVVFGLTLAPLFGRYISEEVILAGTLLMLVLAVATLVMLVAEFRSELRDAGHALWRAIKAGPPL